MRLQALLVVALILVATPAMAQKVYIDYDKDYDFKSIKTFAWAPTSETSLEDVDPLLHSRIVNAIEHYLTVGGIREVDSDSDVSVTYHTSTKENLSLNTTNWGYGYPGGWGWGGYYGGYGGFGSSSTTVTTYDTGTLIVDVWDTGTNNLVWRGTAANMTIAQNPEKMGKKIDKALEKMVFKWRKIKDKKK